MRDAVRRATWGSPRAGTACLLHERCSGACRRFQLPWGQPTCWHLLPPPCALQCPVFVVVVRFVGPLMGGLWVWGVVGVPSPIVAVRGEGLATPPRHQSGHRLRVLRLQHDSVSVNMFGPLLRLPGHFLPLSSAIPSPPGVRASNRSWLLSRSLAPA
jgi:hypothetical protein